MKKKLIQILMLLVATVSVGSFVSCKDTNEDLYNELRSQMVPDNATLQQAIDQQAGQLADLIQKYKDLLAAMPDPCTCDEAAMQAEIDALKGQVAGLLTDVNKLIGDVAAAQGDIATAQGDIAGLKAALTALQGELNNTKLDVAGLTSSFNSEIAGIKNLITLLQTALAGKADQGTVDALIGGLTTQISAIQDGLKTLQDQNLLALIEKNKALQDGLKDRIEALEQQLAAIKSCSCDYTDKFNNYDSKFDDVLQRLAKAEQAIVDNKAWIEQQLADINGDVAAAQTAADNAATLASTANTNAQAALAEAKRIEGLANAAQAAADAAQGDATAAQQAAQAAQSAADLAYALAAQALSTANKANDLAVTVNGLVAGLTARVDANEKNIAQLQQDARDLLKLINDNKDKLQEAIDKVNSELTTKIDDLKGEIQGKLDDLKSDLQGQINDLDGKLTDKVSELISKITEVNNAVIANTKDIEANAKAIAANAENIKSNAAAIEKVQEELKTINANITLATEKANEAYKEASEAKAKADANEKSISDLKVEVGVNAANIKTLEKTTDELKDAVKDLQDKVAQIGVNTKAIEDLSKVVDGVKDDIKGLSEKYGELKTQLGELQTQLAEVKSNCDKNYTELKGYIETEIANLKAAVIKEIADALNNYYDKDAINKILEGYAKQSDLSGLASQDDLDALKDDLSSLSSDFYAEILKLYDKITDGDKAIGDKLYDLAQRVAANEQHLEDIDKVLKSMDEKFVPRETLIAWYWLLMDKINAVDGKVDGLKDELKTYIENLLKGSDFNFVTKDDLEDLVKDLLKDKIDPEKFAQALEDLANLKKRIKALEDGTVKLGDYNVDKTKIWNSINKANEEIGNLKNAVKTINEKLPTMQSDINTLKTKMQNVEKKLTEIENKVKTLRSDVDAIQSFLGQQITGISIQGTYNPMFGTFSIPANIQSNMLVAYYGRPASKVEFPTTDDANYIRKEEVLTDKDWAMISDVDVFTQKAKKVLTNEDAEGKAYAGKVYVTVNPTSVNAAGLNMQIVNTQDKESLITLAPLKKSYDVLEFGFTRTENNNGFYEADAYVDKSMLESVDGIEFNEAELEQVIKDARAELSKMAETFFLSTGATGNLGQVAVDVYQILRDLRMEQKGLKCPFKDVKGKEQAVYSQYNLAATAIKPLTLASLKDLDYETIPGYEAARTALLDQIGGALKGYINVFFTDFDGSWRVGKLRTLSFDGITLLNASEDLITKFETRLSSFTLNGNGYTFEIPATGTVDVMFDKDLKNGGASVEIPAAVKYDGDVCNAKRTTLVIKGDLTDGLTTMLVVPARSDGDGVISAYATVELVDTYASMTGGVVTVLTNDGKTYDVAAFDGAAISTASYVSEFVLNNLHGTDGSVSIPVVTEIGDDLINLLEGQRDVIKVVSDLTKEINYFLDRIRNYETVIGEDIDDFLKNYLVKYLDKINNTTTWFFKSINRRFGPFMVANDTKGFKLLSVFKEEPTILNTSGLKFYPTTKNMELIVPVARKHVAVTNVYTADYSANAQDGDATCVAKLKAANAADKFNTVIDGTERYIEVSALVPGYVYEIAYSVLDFEGNISTQKTYVKVK